MGVLEVSKKFSFKAGFEASYRAIQLDWTDLTFGDMIDPQYGFIYQTQEDIINNPTTVSFPDFSTGFLGYSQMRGKNVSTLIKERLHISIIFGLSGFFLSYLSTVISYVPGRK